MRQTIDVARFVSSILPTALQRNYVHRTLVAFYVGTILDFIGKSKTLDDGVFAFLLPAILTPLQAEGKESKELTVGVIILTSAGSYLANLLLVGHIRPPRRPLPKIPSFFTSGQSSAIRHGILQLTSTLR